MWRNSSSFSSKLLSHSQTNPNSTFPIFSTINGFRSGISQLPSQPLHSSALEIPPSVDTLKAVLGTFESGRSLGFSSSSPPAAIPDPPASFAAVADTDYPHGYFPRVWLLLVDMKITNAKDLVNVLEEAIRRGYPIPIIAEDIEQEALATLVVNKLQGTLKIVALKAHGFGERKVNTLMT